MKYKVTETIGKYTSESEVGKVHLEGAIDTTACGLAEDSYILVETKQPITCSTCKSILRWAKKVAKLES